MYLSTLVWILFLLRAKAKCQWCHWCIHDGNLMVHLTWKNVVVFLNPVIFFFLRQYISRIYIISEIFLARFPKEKSIYGCLFCMPFSAVLISFQIFDEGSHFREELRSWACLSSHKPDYAWSLNRGGRSPFLRERWLLPGSPRAARGRSQPTPVSECVWSTTGGVWKEPWGGLGWQSIRSHASMFSMLSDLFIGVSFW